MSGMAVASWCPKSLKGKFPYKTTGTGRLRSYPPRIGIKKNGKSSFRIRWPPLLGGAVSLHEASTYLRKQLSLELTSMASLEPEIITLLSRWEGAMCERSWWESFLEFAQPLEEVSPVVKSLVTEVPLGDPEPLAVEQFLQTRTVGLDEARREMSLWVGPAQNEIRALEVTTKAVERITAKDVEALISGAARVVQVPGKVVLTRKSGVGKRRLRAVCCGNFIPPSELNTTKSELYAGGIDALTVRVALAFVLQFPSWCGCIVDVKTAFLNAPVRGSEQEDSIGAPIIVVKPPFLLTQLGLLDQSHRWRVRKALYGLQTSPRDWAEHRDRVLRDLRLEEPQLATLHQSVTDGSL